VLLALKAHQVEPIASAIPTLFDDRTAIVTLQNGIPWWYFYNQTLYAGRTVHSVDPSGAISAAIDPTRIIGCVVFPAANLIAPGVIQVVEGNRFTLGEPDGSESPRVQALAEVLTRAGFKAPITADIRGEIWLKLWGNMTFNPISALTHATLVDICQFPLTRELAATMMREAETVANKLGITFRVGIDRRIAGAERVGAHKTSMLQDIEQGRPIELDALLGSVVELAALTETPAPCINAIYALTRLLAKTLETPQGRLQIQR
jgi:2-dehydropantoate 2-reductase